MRCPLGGGREQGRWFPEGKGTLHVPGRKFHRSLGHMGSLQEISGQETGCDYPQDSTSQTFIEATFMTQPTEDSPNVFFGGY